MGFQCERVDELVVGKLVRTCVPKVSLTYGVTESGKGCMSGGS
jgi:hypothetical protein